jgi:hypothetical protein
MVQGLPVPHDATLTHGSAAEYSAHYDVADAGSVNDLNGWYEEELQPGRAWRDWTACPSPEPSRPDDGGQTWRWQKISAGVVRELVLRTSDLHGKVGIDESVSGPVPPSFPCY